MFPPIPTWDGLHPIVIHFPIALLIVAPLFVMAAMFLGDRGKMLQAAALALMVLGSIGLFVAVSTGEGAEEHVQRTTENRRVLHEHEELAEKSRMVFSILTGIYGLLVIVPMARKRPLSPKAALASHGAYALVHAGSLLLIVNTAHLGGRLVHEFGIHARQGGEAAPRAETERGPVGGYEE